MKVNQTHRTMIATVEASTHRGWNITGANGVTYRTFNQWLAALADEYKAKSVLVDVHFTHGWLHRDLTGLTAVKETEPTVQKVVCSWCQRLMRDGVEPISHGICPACEKTMNDEMNAKYNGYGFGV